MTLHFIFSGAPQFFLDLCDDHVKRLDGRDRDDVEKKAKRYIGEITRGGGDDRRGDDRGNEQTREREHHSGGGNGRNAGGGGYNGGGGGGGGSRNGNGGYNGQNGQQGGGNGYGGNGGGGFNPAVPPPPPSNNRAPPPPGTIKVLTNCVKLQVDPRLEGIHYDVFMEPFIKDEGRKRFFAFPPTHSFHHQPHALSTTPHPLPHTA